MMLELEGRARFQRSARRTVVGIVAIAMGAASTAMAQQDDRWTVNFNGSGASAAADAVATDAGGILVAVAVHGAETGKVVVKLGGKPVQAKLAGYDPVSRLCFFKVAEGEVSKPAVWLSSAPDRPGVVLKAGVHTGRTSGWIKRVGGKVLPLALLQVDFDKVSVAPGTPLVDEEGKIAAIVFQRADGHSVYAIPAEAVHRVRKDILQNGRLVRGWLGLSLRVDGDSPKIVRVLPNSPAEDAGMQEGDLISRIGDRKITSYPDVADAFFYVVPGEGVNVSIKRGSRDLDFTLMPTAEKAR